MRISEDVYRILGVEDEEDLKKRYVEPRLNNLRTSYSHVLGALGIAGYDDQLVRLDEALSLIVVNRYIKSVAQQKLVHDLKRTSWDKVGGGLAYWILRIKPVQIIKAIQYSEEVRHIFHLNEMIAFHAGLKLELENDEQIEFVVQRLRDQDRYWSTIAHLKHAPLVPDVMAGEFFVHQIYKSFLSRIPKSRV